MTATLRLRYLLAKRGPAIVLSLLVLGAVLLAGAGAAYAAPPTTEITDHTEKRTVTTSLDASATVTGDTPLYERGQVLREQPVYLLDAAPTANLTVATTTPGDPSGSVDPRIDVVYTARRGGETFWQHAEPLAVETTANGDGTNATATLSIPAVQERVSTYQNEFGKAATVSVALRVSTAYSVGQYDGAFSETYPLTLGSRWYDIETGSASETRSTPVTRTRTLPMDSHLPFVLPLAGGLILLLAGAVTGFAVRRLDGAGGERLADEIHHARYAEWISSATLPDDASATTVEMGSLEALVDVAIDSGKRVVHDPTRGRYAVLDGDVQYTYAPEQSDAVRRLFD